MNYILGQYIGIAVNDGKKYPKKPLLDNIGEGVKNNIMTPDQMESIAKRIANKLNK